MAYELLQLRDMTSNCVTMKQKKTDLQFLNLTSYPVTKDKL